MDASGCKKRKTKRTRFRDLANIRWGKATKVAAESQLADETRVGTRGSNGDREGEDTGAIDIRGSTETMEDDRNSLINEPTLTLEAHVAMEQGETSLETTENSESSEGSEAATVTVEERIVNECDYTETPVTRDSNTTAVYAVATETTPPQRDHEVQVR